VETHGSYPDVEGGSDLFVGQASRRKAEHLPATAREAVTHAALEAPRGALSPAMAAAIGWSSRRRVASRSWRRSSDNSRTMRSRDRSDAAWVSSSRAERHIRRQTDSGLTAVSAG